MIIYLYIKTHNVTGLKYFGKTTKNPYKYSGSGKYWKKHIKKHGNDVTTTVIGEFADIEQCTQFAINFSNENNIVESNEWANLIVENGMDGAPKGHIGHDFTAEEIQAMSQSSKLRWENSEYRTKMSNIHKERWESKPELKENQCKRLKGKKRPSHSATMKEKCNTEEYKKKTSEFFSNLKRTETHNKNVSIALKGIPKTEEHKQKLRVPKNRICRLADRKEMSVGHFKRYDKL
jgi:hypothetical protein